MNLSKVRKAKGARAALAFANRSLLLHLLLASTTFGAGGGYGDRDFAPLPLPARAAPQVGSVKTLQQRPIAPPQLVVPDTTTTQSTVSPVGGSSSNVSLANSVALEDREDSVAPVHFAIESSDNAAMEDASRDIAIRAANHSGIANILAHEQAISRPNRKVSETSEAIRRQYIGALTVRARQTAASQAKQLHYGIAAALEGLRIADQTLVFLERQSTAQQKLVDNGIPIPDPLLISRTITKVEDERLELLSKLQLMRIDLNGLIGGGGCDYTPDYDPRVIPSDIDVCERIQHSLKCRCDLLTLVSLRQTICEDTLETWEQIASVLSGVPSNVPKQKIAVLRFLTKSCGSSDAECSVVSRRQWLDSVISERTRQISAEVEKAFEKKKTAALRWVKANEQVALWEVRIDQLEMLGEVHAVMTELFSAQLNLLQAKGDVVQRWLEWHQAESELELAIGCSRY